MYQSGFHQLPDGGILTRLPGQRTPEHCAGMRVQGTHDWVLPGAEELLAQPGVQKVLV